MIRIFRTARALALVSLAVLLATALAQGMNHGAGAPRGAPMGMGMGMGAAMPMATQTVDEASFLVHMIPHHREAVATAEALAEVTERPELLELLDAIVAGQTAEIASMEAWLDRWHPEVDRDVAYAPMMRDLGQAAAVEDLERAFLEDMIGHHMMAVHEARTLLAGGLAEHAEVADLARSIANGQMREMHQMAGWLGAWFGVDAPMGMGRMGFDGAGFDAPGVGTPGAGPTGMGGMGGMGRHGMGMHGMGMGGMGMGAAVGDRGAAVGAAEAERLALAFLAGRGTAAEAAELAGTTLSYEVVVRVGDAEHVLRVDAHTGRVTLVSDR